MSNLINSNYNYFNYLTLPLMSLLLIQFISMYFKYVFFLLFNTQHDESSECNIIDFNDDGNFLYQLTLILFI